MAAGPLGGVGVACHPLPPTLGLGTWGPQEFRGIPGKSSTELYYGQLPSGLQAGQAIIPVARCPPIVSTRVRDVLGVNTGGYDVVVGKTRV